jgi:hypothetical protein
MDSAMLLITMELLIANSLVIIKHFVVSVIEELMSLVYHRDILAILAIPAILVKFLELFAISADFMLTKDFTIYLLPI